MASRGGIITRDDRYHTVATMRQAQRQAYNRVRNVMIPNMYYREDIGDRWSEEDSDRLHSWGYLRES
jgi:phosphoribosylamine--glycine ligase